MTLRGGLIWGALVLAVGVPLIAATQSPLLQWREPIYIIAGLSGIVGLALLLVQAMLIADVLPGLSGRRVHAWAGMGLVVSVVLHVAGLWITSPPDVIDVLLFRSPTPFAIWGAVAMWAVFIGALLAGLRKQIGLRIWRVGHSVAVIFMIVGTVVHAWLIQGAMENFTKTALCLIVLAGGAWALWRRRVWRLFR